MVENRNTFSKSWNGLIRHTVLHFSHLIWEWWRIDSCHLPYQWFTILKQVVSNGQKMTRKQHIPVSNYHIISTHCQKVLLCAMAFQELEWHKMDDVDFDGNIEDVPELVVKSGTPVLDNRDQVLTSHWFLFLLFYFLFYKRKVLMKIRLNCFSTVFHPVFFQLFLLFFGWRGLSISQMVVSR